MDAGDLPIRALRKAFLLLGLLMPSVGAFANCASHLPLDGTLVVPTCTSGSEGCKPAAELLYAYAGVPDNDPTVLTAAVQTSPWRIYDPELRIISPEEFAAMLRPNLTPKMKHVQIQGSWSGVAPGPGLPSLAQRVSKALGGLPVDGLDGFLWVKADGTHRTTRQAFSAWEGGSYFAREGEDVMAALTVGWYTNFHAKFEAEGNAKGLLLAAVGFDTFSLCPDQALAAFEHAAKAGSAVAAYNAAMMRLERDGKGDRDAAQELLQRAAELGDEKAKTRLEQG